MTAVNTKFGTYWNDTGLVSTGLNLMITNSIIVPTIFIFDPEWVVGKIV